MTTYTWGNAGSKATTERVEGSTVGTLKVKLTDSLNEVASIEFKVIAIDENDDEVRSSGPHPPDVTRRPGWYEKDVVLDPEFRTLVEVILRREDGSRIVTSPASMIATFAARVALQGTGSTLVVQDQLSAAAATTLVFQGPVVTVDSSTQIATLNLDGRYLTSAAANALYYTHAQADARYATLGGSPSFAGSVVAGGGRALLGYEASNGNARLELGTSEITGTVPYIDFHYGVGSAQDYNARLLNNANNMVTLSFAGTGTFNVQGTIQQNGTPVSLAGHTHAYIPLTGGTVNGGITLAGDVGQLGIVERAGTAVWYDWASADKRRFWYSGTTSDRMVIDGPTGTVSATSFQAGGGAFIGEEGARMTIGNSGVRFLGSGGTALGARVGTLLVTDNYNEPTGAASTSITAIVKGSVLSRGPYGGFVVGDRTGGSDFTLYSTASLLRFWGPVLGADLVTIDQFGTLAARGTIVGPEANLEHGRIALTSTNLWGAGVANHPTIGSTGNSIIMLAAPHVPFKPGYGAIIRHAINPGVSATWDAGCHGADAYSIGRGGVDRLTLDANGTLTVTGEVWATDWGISSDARLKTQVRPLTGASERLEGLRGYTYELRSEPGRERVGVLAQEVQEAYPWAVLTGADGMLGVNYALLAPLLVEGFHDLSGRLARLEARAHG